MLVSRWDMVGTQNDVFFVEVADADTSTVAASSSTGSGQGCE